MENKMYAKQQFKCAICGQVYDEVKDRMDCESKCLKKQEIEARKVAEAKKKEEQLARKAKVDAAYDTADKLRDEYVEDYGVYTRIDKKVTNAFEREYEWPKFEDLYRLFID